ncbi:hypothetical protein EVAR_36436_1 [Eumeta japonica]|uniref:Uncharacterized protein n=1 Tax=Eumeta variegata TaxID=151549 RepID=A0A4C1VQ85_EUMVA|nr:hypothetical protein EVAR_36436_1 [Eumeta japonica]
MTLGREITRCFLPVGFSKIINSHIRTGADVDDKCSDSKDTTSKKIIEDFYHVSPNRLTFFIHTECISYMNVLVERNTAFFCARVTVHLRSCDTSM